MKSPLCVLFDYESEQIHQPMPSPYPVESIHMASYMVVGKGINKPKTKLAVNKKMPKRKGHVPLEQFHNIVKEQKPKYIIAHNLIAFDRHLLEGAIGKIPKGVRFLDTLILSRRLFTEYESHALGTWGRILGYAKDDYSAVVKQRIMSFGAGYNRGDEFKRKHIIDNFDHAARYCIRDNDLMAKIIITLVNRMFSLNLTKITQVKKQHLDGLYEYSKLENEAQLIMFKSQQAGIPVDMERLEKAGAEILEGKDKVYNEIQEDLNITYEVTDPITPVRAKTVQGIKMYHWQYKEATPFAIKRGNYIKKAGKKYALDKDGKRVVERHPSLPFVPYCPLIKKPFNPNSNTQVPELLLDMGWKPISFTDTGNPKCGVKYLEAISETYPVVKKIIEYKVFSKQYSFIIGGDKSLKNNYNHETGSIHHLNQIAGASSSSRSSHIPNVSQVTRVKIDSDGFVFGRPSKWGTDMRWSFKPYKGHVQVGCDLSGLELRTVAEMTSPYDGGTLIELILEGDIHTQNVYTILKGIKDWYYQLSDHAQKILQREWKDKPKKERKKLIEERKNKFTKEQFKEVGKLPIIFDRDSSKKSLYTFMYGGGNLKIGHDAFPYLENVDKMSAGKTIRESLYDSLTGLKEVIESHKSTVQQGEYVQIFDGSIFATDKEYLILSRINQSTGARIALNWVVDSYNAIEKYCKKHGLVMWKDVGLLGFFHDEMQWSIVPEHAETLGKILTKQSLKTGKRLGFTIPIDSEYKIGKNWAECH